MYARITYLEYNDEGYAQRESIAEEVVESVMKISGIQHFYSMLDEGRSGCVVAVYESKQAAQIAAPQAREMLSSYAPYLAAPPQIKEYGVLSYAAADVKDTEPA